MDSLLVDLAPAASPIIGVHDPTVFPSGPARPAPRRPGRSIGASLRQSLAPDGMLGRVQGAYRAVSNGGLLAGATLGGLLTSAGGLTAPLWLGLAATTAAVTLSWRPFATPHTVVTTP